MRYLIVLFFFVASFASLRAQSAYTNAVINPGDYGLDSAADPFVLKDTDGMYYCYVTGAGFPVFSSRDLVNWKYIAKSFPKARALWATANFWAPEVVKVGSYYYLNYTASETDDSPKRIGLARSKSPVGPFDDVSDVPFYSLGAKGCIDSDIFIDDDGRTYLYYSLAPAQNIVNGVARSEIWGIEVKPDLSGFIGVVKQLFIPTLAWESNITEAPTMVKHNGTYYLMYSGNGYSSAKYAVGYATSESPLGTFTKYAGNPILINGNMGPAVTGTGHNAVTTSPDGTELICVYHSHIDLASLGGGPRKVNIDRMGFTSNGIMYINGPTNTPQNYPSSTPVVEGKAETWFDVDFNTDEWLDAFNDAGYDFRATAAGNPVTFSTDDVSVNDFIFNANGYKEGAPFTSVCERDFQYSIRLRQQKTPTYIEFPEVANAGKITLYVQNPNTSGTANSLSLQKKNEDGDWDPLFQWSVPALNLLSPSSDYELNYRIDTREPVSLRIYREEDRFLKVFRMILEKYDTGSSIKSSNLEKIDLSVTGKTLFLSGIVNNADLSVFDLTGKQVFACRVNSDKIDLQNIDAGIYIVKLIAEQGEITRKVVVK